MGPNIDDHLFVVTKRGNARRVFDRDTYEKMGSKDGIQEIKQHPDMGRIAEDGLEDQIHAGGDSDRGAHDGGILSVGGGGGYGTIILRDGGGGG